MCGVHGLFADDRHANFIGPGLGKSSSHHCMPRSSTFPTSFTLTHPSVSSIAYIDPGNWATDLEAGANYGYSELRSAYPPELT